MRGLYFILVLVLLLAIVYIALECKTPPDDGGYDLEEPEETIQNRRDSSLL